MICVVGIVNPKTNDESQIVIRLTAEQFARVQQCEQCWMNIVSPIARELMPPGYMELGGRIEPLN
jgi:hypothetical protein